MQTNYLLSNIFSTNLYLIVFMLHKQKVKIKTKVLIRSNMIDQSIIKFLCYWLWLSVVETM